MYKKQYANSEVETNSTFGTSVEHLNQFGLKVPVDMLFIHIKDEDRSL